MSASGPCVSSTQLSATSRDHLGEADGDDDEIGAAHPERQLADEIAAQARDDDRQHEADDRRPGLVHHAKLERQAGTSKPSDVSALT